jgi:hypothetical protein
MSFFALRTSLAPRAVTFAVRPISTSSVLHKSATETVKDGLKTVDRAVSDKIVDGIEVGRKFSSFLYSLFPIN